MKYEYGIGTSDRENLCQLTKNLSAERGHINVQIQSVIMKNSMGVKPGLPGG